jgi:hypothetical protein
VPEDLALLQRRFFRLVLAPAGIEAELPAFSRDDPMGVPLRRWIRAPDEAGAQERLSVYANMYFFRLLDVLRGDYPKLAAVLGDATMHNLATDYLLRYPSDNPSLRYLGRHLPGFLCEHDLGRKRPELWDLAALEWARVEAFDVADEAVLTREEVAALPEAAWPAHAFRAVGSARTLSLHHPAHEIWNAVDRGEAAPVVEARPTELLIWRRGWWVHHRPIERDERSALARVLAARPFAEVCAALGEELSEADAARTAVGLLLRWIDEGLLAGT